MTREYSLRVERLEGPGNTELFSVFCDELGRGSISGQGVTFEEALGDFEANKEAYLAQLAELVFWEPPPLHG